MKWSLVSLLLCCVVFFSCEKNTVSKIPHITRLASGPDSMRATYDTAYIQFSFTDGDGDLGNDTSSSVYIKDKRFDTAAYVRYDFPDIDPNIEDPKKGLQGKGIVFLLLAPPVPRPDTLHTHYGDTTTYEMYITDRARNESNHIITPPIIIRP